MEALLFGIKVLNVLTSTDMVVSILSNLSRSANNVTHLIACIGKLDNGQIMNELNKLDIENRIKIVKLILKDMEKQKEKS